ncbi:MAG: serine/threonine-protein kinase [Verrucomicrobiota bacterium]
MMPADGLPPPESPDTFQPPSAEELSAMLPQFEISHLIAVGGMGAVYAGVQRALDRPVALKILPPEAARDNSAIERFRTEGKAMARLTHQNIPTVYDFDVQGGYCYLVMEYVDGWNVHQLIQQGEMTPDRAMNLLGQVCDALTFAHQCGIMHGDIKPSNLLVNQQGILKLADFGLAQLLEHTGRNDGEWSPMGTPEYAAPELWDPHARLDERSDLYSLGAVFYEMLTGAPPRGEFQLPATALRLDRRVDSIIDGCMKQDPAHRYQTAAQVRQQLDDITRKPVVPKGPAPVKIIRANPIRRPGSGRPRAPKGPDLMPLLWILLVAAVIAGVVYVVRRPPPPGPVTEKPQQEITPASVPR